MYQECKQKMIRVMDNFISTTTFVFLVLHEYLDLKKYIQLHEFQFWLCYESANYFGSVIKLWKCMNFNDLEFLWCDLTNVLAIYFNCKNDNSSVIKQLT